MFLADRGKPMQADDHVVEHADIQQFPSFNDRDLTGVRSTLSQVT